MAAEAAQNCRSHNSKQQKSTKGYTKLWQVWQDLLASLPPDSVDEGCVQSGCAFTHKQCVCTQVGPLYDEDVYIPAEGLAGSACQFCC